MIIPGLDMESLHFQHNCILMPLQYLGTMFLLMPLWFRCPWYSQSCFRKLWPLANPFPLSKTKGYKGCKINV
jgi:hypothetical protein